MKIGEEQEAQEYPEPVAPGQTPIHEPSPQVEPVKEPAKVSYTELEDYLRCGRG
ncbi:MAG TPA: hypothetical protein VNS88_05055 [Nitrospiraceae bacterium]|nr:hypothetical protein [Nitrospiraceae bacterium]